jgi:hypothetical protein
MFTCTFIANFHGYVTIPERVKHVLQVRSQQFSASRLEHHGSALAVRLRMLEMRRHVLGCLVQILLAHWHFLEVCLAERQNKFYLLCLIAWHEN